MTSHSSSGLGIYLVAHRRFRPKPPVDGILKYKKKKKKKPPQTPTTYPRQNGSGHQRSHPPWRRQKIPVRLPVMRNWWQTSCSNFDADNSSEMLRMRGRDEGLRYQVSLMAG